MHTTKETQPGPWRCLAALALFGIAFGYVEAAVVVYVRGLYEPLHRRLHPECAADDLFPLIRLDQLAAEEPQYLHWLGIELAREAATLLMLAAVALAMSRNIRQWLAAFGIAFGIWDIFFYAFLEVLLGWPASPFTWDLLFLLPVPWTGPVLAPILVALSMIGGGVLVLWREAQGRPLRPGHSHWACLLTAALLIVAAFCWDFRNVLDGREPGSFAWPLFLCGEGMGIITFCHVLYSARCFAMYRAGEFASPVGEQEANYPG